MTDGGTRIQRRRDTERRILTAARRLFAEVGYERATIRAIATAAGTDPGLVMRYYGSKQRLFDAAADVSIAEVAQGGPGDVADALLASLAAKLAVEPTATLASLRSMLTHPEATEQVHAAIAQQEKRLAAAIPGDDAAARAGLVSAILLGTVVGRYLLRLDGLRDTPPDHLIALLGPHIRALLSADGTARDAAAPTATALR